jgi:CarD family transcriptional regulator
MEFSVGDHVVHPKHGAGRITGAEQLELVEGFENYYVIEIRDKRLVVRVPVCKMEELGVRPAMPRSKLASVMDRLRSMPLRLSANLKTRQARIQEKLKTGQPLKIAEVIRDLTWLKRRARLSGTDAFLLDRSQELLATEIALITDTDATEARRTISMALMNAMASESSDKEPEKTQEQVPQGLNHCPATGKPVREDELEHFTILEGEVIWWHCPVCQGLHILNVDKKQKQRKPK